MKHGQQIWTLDKNEWTGESEVSWQQFGEEIFMRSQIQAFFFNAGQIQQKKGCLSFICSHLEPGFRLMNLADPDTSKTI